MLKEIRLAVNSGDSSDSTVSPSLISSIISLASESCGCHICGQKPSSLMFLAAYTYS